MAPSNSNTIHRIISGFFPGSLTKGIVVFHIYNSSRQNLTKFQTEQTRERSYMQSHEFPQVTEGKEERKSRVKVVCGRGRGKYPGAGRPAPPQIS